MNVSQVILREMQPGDVIVFPSRNLQATMNSVTTAALNTGAKFTQRKVVMIDMKEGENLIRGVRVECIASARPRKTRGRKPRRSDDTPDFSVIAPPSNPELLTEGF